VNVKILDHDPAALKKTMTPFGEMVLISEDGVPLETAWHRYCMTLLIEVATSLCPGRNDFYVGGNMFIYFSAEHVFNADFRGPDFFFVDGGVNLNPPRDYWATWEEGDRFPDVIIELLSPTTAHIDRTVKRELYEQRFHTRNYFCYDPNNQLLEGWILDADGHYQPLQLNEHGRLWCEVLGVWVGTWQGVYQRFEDLWLRFYDRENRLVPSAEERERIERQRADALETELARLRAQLGQQHPDNGHA
jgi:Uma2 family endonuclease